MDSNSRTERQDCAAALRVIGQELADLLPLHLEIEIKGTDFVVSGKGLSESETAKKSLLSKVWRALIHRDPGTDIVDWQLNSTSFSHTYSQDDLSRSDEHHFTKRTGSADLPDIYSLGERLRIVGRLVNAKGGELVHLTKTLNSVSFQYRDKDGVLQSEEYSADDLFRIQQQYSSDREN